MGQPRFPWRTGGLFVRDGHLPEEGAAPLHAAEQVQARAALRAVERGRAARLPTAAGARGGMQRAAIRPSILHLQAAVPDQGIKRISAGV